MVFHEVRFPEEIAFGSRGGPERRTEIVTLGSGFEERNTPWAHSRRRYDAGYGMRTLDDLHEVVAFYEARRGRLHGFRWKDAADFKSVAPGQPVTPFDQAIGEGDGSLATFSLKKSYVSGAESYERPIVKPVTGTVRVGVDGVEQALGADFSIDPATGEVTFVAGKEPSAGSTVSAGFEFDVPVRFDTDRLEINLAAFKAGAIPAVSIVEVRL